MNRSTKRLAAILAGAAWLLAATGSVSAQESQAPPPSWESMTAQQPPPAPAAEALSPAELDQLTAPVALYSDPLLGMVLTAATYPLEIVEAARWLDADNHASLKGDELDAALAQEGWDTSVKALVTVPEVLRMMNENLEWTERLGDAFLSQQSEVMDSVQRLRQRAAASGGLKSSPQETVSREEGDIIIEPATPDVIYVPCYTPVIYGPWPWPAYPAFYFPPPAGFCYPGPLISFGIGFGIIGPYWGWGRWNWHQHGFYVAPRRFHRGPIPIRPWVHDPAHRHGVPYRDLATSRGYPAPNTPSSRPSRGYPSASAQAPRPGVRPRAAPGQHSVRPAPTAPTRNLPPPVPRASDRVRPAPQGGSAARPGAAPRGGSAPRSGGHPSGERPHGPGASDLLR